MLVAMLLSVIATKIEVIPNPWLCRGRDQEQVADCGGRSEQQQTVDVVQDISRAAAQERIQHREGRLKLRTVYVLRLSRTRAGRMITDTELTSIPNRIS